MPLHKKATPGAQKFLAPRRDSRPGMRGMQIRIASAQDRDQSFIWRLQAACSLIEGSSVTAVLPWSARLSCFGSSGFLPDRIVHEDYLSVTLPAAVAVFPCRWAGDSKA